MDLEFATGVAGLTGAALALAVGAFVWLVAPARMQNRLVALLLFFSAVEVGSTFGILNLFRVDEGTERGLAALNTLTWFVQPCLYLAVLGTLGSPLAAPFRSATAQRALLALALAMLPAWFVVGPYVVGNALVAGLALAFHGVVMLFGVVVAVSAWRRASPLSADRARARAFAFAFGARDLGTGVGAAYAGIALVWTAGTDPLPEIFFFLVPLSVVLLALLMGYGIARASLFDIDLKVKWTLRRGTVAAVFLGAFFVVAQIAQDYLTGAFGWLAGGAAAGMLLLAVRPIERAAGRLADAAMPSVHDTHEFRAGKKREVYRAAFEGALLEGGVTDRDRSMLARVADQLGLTAVETVAIEREVRAAAGVA